MLNSNDVHRTLSVDLFLAPNNGKLKITHKSLMISETEGQSHGLKWTVYSAEMKML